EAGPHGDRLHKNRPVQRPLDALRRHEQWMVSRDVVGPSVLVRVAPAPLRCTGRLVLDQLNVAEGPGRPSVQIGLYLVYRVPAGRHDEGRYPFPTRAAIDLRCSSYMKLGVPRGIDSRLPSFQPKDGSSPDSELFIGCKPLEASL